MRLVRLRKTSRPHSEQSVTRLRSELGTPKNETGMVERLDGILEQHARYVVHETTDSIPTADPRVKMLNPLNVLLTLSRNIRRNAARIRVKLSQSTP